MLCEYAENLIFPTGCRFIEHEAEPAVSPSEDETPVVDASLRLLRNKTSMCDDTIKINGVVTAGCVLTVQGAVDCDPKEVKAVGANFK